MKHITKGNDFQMRIPVVRIHNGERIPMPLPACTDIVVNICSPYRRISLAYTIDVAEDNVILAKVEGDQLYVGRYALEVKGKIGGVDWRSNEYEQIAIVDNNASADTSFDVTEEGENSLLMDTAVAILAPDTGLYDKVLTAEEAREVAESARQSAESERIAKEQERKTNEDERKASEASRVENESVRLANEQSRTAAEAERVKAENIRKQNESERVRNESSRSEAETAREKEEAKRQSAEAARQQAESERISKEQERKAAETSRQEAETARANAETKRANAETKRADAETARANAEKTRQQAETNRAEAETLRQQKESERQEAETLRANAETKRTEAENIRKQKETERQEAEQERIENNKKCVTATNSALSAAEKATTAANNAMQVASTAEATIAKSEKAASDAAAAVQTANSALSAAGDATAAANNATKNATTAAGEANAAADRANEAADLVYNGNPVTTYIHITTDVVGVDVSGLPLVVWFDDNKDTAITVTTDDSGTASFDSRPLTKFCVTYPKLPECQDLPQTIGFVGIASRTYEIKYSALPTALEQLTLRVYKWTGTTSERFANCTVHVTIAGETIDYLTDSNGEVQLEIPYGTEYIVAIDEIEGLYTYGNIYQWTYIAGATRRLRVFNYRDVMVGMFYVCKDGTEYLYDEFVASGRDIADAVMIKVVTADLAKTNNVFGVDIDSIANGVYINNNMQWCVQNKEFKTVPMGITADGLEHTVNIDNESKTYALATPAATYCLSKVFAIGDIELQGFLGAVQQKYALTANEKELNTMLAYVRPDAAYTFSKFFGTQTWTSDQYSSVSAYLYSRAANNVNKNNSYAVEPFYAF